MTQLIACVGPESSGKSTLATTMGVRLRAVVVPELARAMLTRADGYDLANVEAIARAQLNAERSALAAGHDPIVLDTDLTVIAIWCAVRFGSVPGWIDRALASATPRTWLLLEPDLPWQADPLRENPHDRERLYGLYESLLGRLVAASGSAHRLVRIAGSDRLDRALAAVGQRA